jgi:Lrp/AsnC family transcriptional regulator, regulator for asnA, asnC and gidA
MTDADNGRDTTRNAKDDTEKKQATGANGRRRPGRRRVSIDGVTTSTPGDRPRAVMQPDDLDRQIISLLRQDGRRSNREVARRLNVPEATVRYRVRRLTDSGILKIAASVDPEHLGYALTSVISVQVEPRLFVETSNAISAMPEVMWLAITAGATDIIFTASFHNQEEMFTFIADRLAHVEGIDRIETSVCMRVVKKSHQWSTDLTSAIAADTSSKPVAFDDLDLFGDDDDASDEVAEAEELVTATSR